MLLHFGVSSLSLSPQYALTCLPTSRFEFFLKLCFVQFTSQLIHSLYMSCELARRHGCRLFHAVSSGIFALFSSVPSRSLSVQTVCSTTKTDKIFGENQAEKRKLILSHQIVNSTLLNCSCDLLSLSFFLWCAKQPTYFHNSLVIDHMVGVLLRLTGRFKTVKGILVELENIGCVTKPQTFLLLLRIYWRSGKNYLVFEVFEQMSCYGFTPNTFAHNVIMDVFFKIGRPDDAINVLKQMPLPNFLTFNIALSYLSKLDDLVSVREAFRSMMRMGYYPNARTFEMLLNCFCKKGRLAEAYQLLSIMITLGIPLTVNIWSILIDGFCRTRRLSGAAVLLEKMVKTGGSPNIVTYTSLIKGYMDSELVSDAFGVLKIMESKGCCCDLVLCNVLIDSLCKIGRYDDAFGIFIKMENQKIAPDAYTFSSLLSTVSLSKRCFFLHKLVSGLLVEFDLVVYNSLLRYSCKDEVSSLVSLYNEMLDRGFTPDRYTFAELLSGLCRSRRIEDAINIYHGILLNYTGLDAHVHTVVIGGLIKAGKFHSALRIFQKATLENYRLDVVSYTVIIRGFLRGRRIKEACHLYRQMKEVGISPTAQICNILLSGFCKERDLRLVEQMLREMMGLRVQLRCNNFFWISSILRKSECSALVGCLLIEMRDLGLIPDWEASGLLYDKPMDVVEVIDEDLSKGCLKNDQFVDSSSSEDFSDMAVSMG